MLTKIIFIYDISCLRTLGSVLASPPVGKFRTHQICTNVMIESIYGTVQVVSHGHANAHSSLLASGEWTFTCQLYRRLAALFSTSVPSGRSIRSESSMITLGINYKVDVVHPPGRNANSLSSRKFREQFVKIT